jgi:hypothetical protein
MTEESTLEVFTAKGTLRDDFRDEEIEALTPERRRTFFALVKASTDAAAATQEDIDADADIRACVEKLASAQAAHNAANPPVDRIDELRRVIAVQNAAARG